jgi:hypothetical protein
VLLLDVVAEPLAMVGKQHDQRAVVETALLEPGHEAVQDAVGVRDLAVIGMDVALVEGRRGIPGTVRVEQVEEEEEAFALADAVEPGRGAGSGNLSAPLRERALAERGGSVVCVEALGDTGIGAEDHRRDEPRGAIAAAPEPFGQRLPLVEQGIALVVADAVVGGEQPGEDRGVGRQSERVVAERPLEQDRVGGEGVDGGGADAAVTVGRQVIGAQRVDRDEHERAPQRRRGPRLPAAGSREEQGCREESTETSDERGGLHAGLYAAHGSRSRMT